MNKYLSDRQTSRSYISAMQHAAAVEVERDATIARWLSREDAMRIADVGCGVGAMSTCLASAFPSATLVAVDESVPMVDAARARITASDLGSRVSVRRLDVTSAEAPTHRFDLVWASHMVHHLADQESGLRTLRGWLADNGRLALAEGGLPSRWLPWDIGIGEPGLELRLDAARDQTFRHLRAGFPDAVAVPIGWPSLLRAAGFAAVHSKSFLLDIPAPLPRNARAHLVEELRSGRDRNAVAGLLSDADIETLTALTDPSSVHYVADRHDTFHLSAVTVHLARI